MEKKLLGEEVLVELLNDYLAIYAEHDEHRGLVIVNVVKIEERNGINWRMGTVCGKAGSAERRLIGKVYEQARTKFNLE